jgi:BirA family transcriptional regulator, biotin operon repressor / biotin---[acetyl-CoA-carboxylase] ligase
MNTLFVGQNLIHLKTADSTNSYATELLRQISPLDGTVIYTFNQLNGRGQRGSLWESERGKNIAMSIVLKPSFIAVEEQFILSKIAAIAVADLMSELLDPFLSNESIKIKWPNDIYINHKKVAGILIENTFAQNAYQYAIVGIGVNVNQVVFENKRAVSLKQVSQQEFDLLDVIKRLCKHVEYNYLQLKANKHEALNQRYLQLLYGLNELKQFETASGIFKGIIRNVEPSGKLMVENESKELLCFDLKEISLII